MAAPASPTGGRFRSAVRTFVRWPVSGLLPWIPTAVLTGPELVPSAVGLSLLISVTILVATRWVGDHVKALERIDIGYFALVGVVLMLGGAQVGSVVGRWLGEVSLIVILVYAVGTLTRSRPFTEQYTAIGLAPDQSAGALFQQWNRRSTGLWIGVFGVQLAAMVVAETLLGDPDDVVFGWLLPIGALVVGFVGDARLTRRYRTAIIHA